MKQATLHSVDELVGSLREHRARRIGIDGSNGVGKSTLAREIGQRLHLPVIRLDDYLDDQGDGFVEYLRYPELAEALDRPEFVVEGVCLLRALANLGTAVDLLIYVKRMQEGRWHDEDTCAVAADEAEAVIAREQETLRAFVQIEAELYGAEQPGDPPDLPGLTQELIRYHAEFRPHERAQILYENEFS